MSLTRLMPGVCGFIGTLIVAPLSLHAVAFNTPINLSLTGQDADGAHVAVDASGEATAIWRRSDAMHYIVQTAKRPAGGVFGAAADLSAAGLDAFEPQLAMNAAGAATAVWRRSNGTNFVIQAATRSAGGSFSAAETLSALGGDAGAPQVAMDTAGNTLVVWRRFDGANFVVQATVISPGGSFFPGVDLSEPGQDAFEPRVAMNGAGNAIVVWRESNDTNFLVRARLRPAGGPFLELLDLSAAGQDADSPRAAMDATGNTIVAWRRSNGSNFIVQAARRPAGGAFDAPIDLSAAGADAFEPQLAVNATGEAILAWRRSNGANFVVQTVVLAGGAFSAIEDVSATGQDASVPQVAINSAGTAFVAWHAYNAQNFAFHLENFVVHLDDIVIQTASRPSGGNFGAALKLSVAGEDAFGHDIAANPATNATLVWRRSDATNFIVQGAANIPPLTISRAVGRPGGLVCLAAKLTNAGSPTGGTNDIGDMLGLPFSFSALSINPAIGAGTGFNKTVERANSGGIDTFTLGGPGMTGIPDGDLYTATYIAFPMAPLATYVLAEPDPAGAEIVLSKCTGDCDGSGAVSIAEVQLCMNKFLGAPLCDASNSASNCPIADGDNNLTVGLGEVEKCVQHFVAGCGPS